MAEELADAGLDIPGIVSHSQDVQDPSVLAPEDHHDIAASQKNYVVLSQWQLEKPDDPAVQVCPSLPGIARCTNSVPHDVLIQNYRHLYRCLKHT